MKDLKDYTQIENPYSDFVDRRIENISPVNLDQAVRDGGVVNDLWVSSFIRSEDWSPDGGGFSLDGSTGEAIFNTVIVNNIVNQDGDGVGFPGGSATELQYNNAGAFAGISSATFSGGILTLTTPTITKPILDATNPSAQTYSPGIAGTATLDLSLANEHRITMPAGNITIALSNDTLGQKFVVSILQDSGGSRTVTWFTTIRWAGGSAPTLTTTASKRDTFGFIRTGAGTYDGFIIGQNI